jgi:hypothetical protein
MEATRGTFSIAQNPKTPKPHNQYMHFKQFNEISGGHLSCQQLRKRLAEELTHLEVVYV